MPGYSNPGFYTLALHAGAAPDPATGARATRLDFANPLSGAPRLERAGGRSAGPLPQRRPASKKLLISSSP
jgi:hypothetical protein